MKIGVLTLPFNNNYGGVLQSFALQKFLHDRGHEVIIINQPVETFKTKIKNIIRVFIGRRSYFNNTNFKLFLQEFMIRSKVIHNNEELKRYSRNNNFDAFVVGSDQVWRFKYTNENYQRYFLEFLNSTSNIKKISFAASFGVDSLEASPDEQFIVSKLLTSFDGVSVREHSGIELCKNFFGYEEAIQLLDPTLLHTADFYRKLYKGDESTFSGKIGVYLLDDNDNKKQLVSECKELLKIESSTIGKFKSLYGYNCMTIPQWLYAFDTADFIITDSFHGMVFSIIFRKKFLVIGNKARGLSRFTSMLKDFDMLDRLVEEDSLINSTLLHMNTSKVLVSNVIEENVNKSNQFLTVNGL